MQFTTDTIHSKDELKTLYSIDQEAYGEDSIDYKKFLAWWRASPNGLTVLKNSKNQIVGGLGLWPITPEIYKKLENGNLSEENIQAENLLTNPQTHWYLSGLVLIPTLQRTLRSGKLILQLFSAWNARSPKPAKIVAIASSPMGEALLTTRQFRKNPNPTAQGYPIYSKTIVD